MINYYLITKPGIIMGNLFTLAAGFMLASKGIPDPQLFLITLLGLGFIIASACVFNNYIDRQLDVKMERTKQRPIASGLISGRNAIAFATILAIFGNVILGVYTNLLTVSVAAIGFFIYVVLYSMWKSRTIYATAIGSIAGAIPPVVGYCAVSNQFDLGAALLFMMLVLWQMPHFFSIALYHFRDYSRANIPLLPIKKGVFRTKIHMVIYIMAFIFASTLLTYFNYTGYLYYAVTLVMGGAWLLLGLIGFKRSNNEKWGRDMFRLSLILIGTLCLVIPFDVR
jgi:protoheme IX farnesyltransferase